VEIINRVPSGVAKDPQGTDPNNLDLTGGQAKFIPAGLSLSLSVTCSARGVCVVRVAGELDMVTAPLLGKCLKEQLAVGTTHLVVDLEAVKFMGSAGLNTLLTARELAQAAGLVLHLAGMRTRAVVLPLEVTGLLPLFNVSPTLADALGELTCEHGEPISTGWLLTDGADR
jgi:anti-sigma B factor antagonist